MFIGARRYCSKVMHYFHFLRKGFILLRCPNLYTAYYVTKTNNTS